MLLWELEGHPQQAMLLWGVATLGRLSRTHPLNSVPAQLTNNIAGFEVKLQHAPFNR
jgi:hypothetical protein